MSKAKKYIIEHTSVLKDSNGKKYFRWLSPDQAREAVEIARDEMTEKACDAYCKVCGHYAHTTPIYICRQACDYYKDFKQAMKDE